MIASHHVDADVEVRAVRSTQRPLLVGARFVVKTIMRRVRTKAALLSMGIRVELCSVQVLIAGRRKSSVPRTALQTTQTVYFPLSGTGRALGNGPSFLRAEA
jgi:hypothetical protein